MKIIAAFAIGLALAAMLPAVSAHAQNARSFVSPTGSDSSPSCSLAAPCRTFAAAYALTNAGGEIAVLGTAGYGTLTISKAISIVNGGGFEAGIAVPLNATGITINAGPNDAISLRGLSIEGGGIGQTGISFVSGKSLNVDNCVVRHLTSNGIQFTPTTASNLVVSNSVASDNDASGVVVTSVLTGAVNATVTDSVANGNTNGVAFAASRNQGAPTVLTVIRSTAASNGWGFLAQNGATIRVAQSTVTGNVNGWEADTTGVVQSYGNNYINGNTNQETAPPSVVMK
jgi:Right handed beta helix region